MISLLANLFRGLSFIFGITAPPPEQDQRSFVYMWLVIVAVLVVFLRRTVLRDVARASPLTERIVDDAIGPTHPIAHLPIRRYS